MEKSCMVLIFNKHLTEVLTLRNKDGDLLPICSRVGEDNVFCAEAILTAESVLNKVSPDDIMKFTMIAAITQGEAESRFYAMRLRFNSLQKYKRNADDGKLCLDVVSIALYKSFYFSKKGMAKFDGMQMLSLLDSSTAKLQDENWHCREFCNEHEKLHEIIGLLEEKRNQQQENHSHEERKHREYHNGHKKHKGKSARRQVPIGMSLAMIFNRDFSEVMAIKGTGGRIDPISCPVYQKGEFCRSMGDYLEEVMPDIDPDEVRKYSLVEETDEKEFGGCRIFGLWLDVDTLHKYDHNYKKDQFVAFSTGYFRSYHNQLDDSGKGGPAVIKLLDAAIERLKDESFFCESFCDEHNEMEGGPALIDLGNNTGIIIMGGPIKGDLS